MSKPSQPLIFVDTNILLDFYRVRNDSGIKLLQRLDSLHSQIITTYQVEMEFKRNRQRVIVAFLEELRGCGRTISAPAFLAETKTNKALSALLSRSRAQAEKMKRRLVSLVETPSKDPVWRVADSLFRNTSPINLRRDNPARSEIKEKASMRFRLGYPPRKASDTSIGDAFNWEWVVRCIEQENRDVIIVSRDADYGITLENDSFPNDWLVQEVRERTNPRRKIWLVDRLSKALKRLKIEVSSDELRQESTAARSEAVIAAPPPALGGANVLDILSRLDPDAEAKAGLAEFLVKLGITGAGTSLPPPIKGAAVGVW